MWASDFSYRKGWSIENCSPRIPSSIFLICFTFSHIFCWLSNSLKQAVWQRSEPKCRFHIYLYIFILLVLERQTIFVLMSLKTVTQIFPPRVIEVFYTTMYFILKCPTNTNKTYSNVASTVPFLKFWNLAGESFCRKKIPLLIKMAL